MKTWIDYTNHRGKRDWREVVIDNIRTLPITMEKYPPAAAGLPHLGSEILPCMNVFMVDRNAVRTLALKSINGIFYGLDKPDIFTGMAAPEKASEVYEHKPEASEVDDLRERLGMLEERMYGMFREGLLEAFDTFRENTWMRLSKLEKSEDQITTVRATKNDLILGHERFLRIENQIAREDAGMRLSRLEAKTTNDQSQLHAMRKAFEAFCEDTRMRLLKIEKCVRRLERSNMEAVPATKAKPENASPVTQAQAEQEGREFLCTCTDGGGTTPFGMTCVRCGKLWPADVDHRDGRIDYKLFVACMKAIRRVVI